MILVIASATYMAVGAKTAPGYQAASYKADADTGVDFQGTDLLPKSSGTAKISNREGRVAIDADFKGLEPARNFGTEFMTYVLWAVTPEGRVSNVGELLLDGAQAHLDASTRFQSFGLFVSAEPYFAVGAPSTKIVLQNVFPEKAKYAVVPIDTNSPLFNPIDYRSAGFEPMSIDPKVPGEVYQARNAVRIAKWQHADEYAPEIWAKAEAALNDAETALAAKKSHKVVASAARVAVQTAEDARTTAAKMMEEAKAAAERSATADAEAEAQAAAAQAEAAQAQARAASAERAAMEQQKAQAEAASAGARLQAEQAKAAAQKLRQDLMAQLNRVLETKDTDRGLVVSMAGVLFGTGKSDLTSEAREKLAKLSGIMAANPTLKLGIEGYTDNTGSDATNEALSLARAESVRGYLVGQGVPSESMNAKGLGSAMPIADNATDDGRQKNRRVEIIISGEAIGS